MPVANSPGLTNLQLAAFCRLSIYLLFSITASRLPQNELASDCQLPVAYSQEFANWHLAAVCLLPIQVLCYKPLSNRIGI